MLNNLNLNNNKDEMEYENASDDRNIDKEEKYIKEIDESQELKYYQ